MNHCKRLTVCANRFFEFAAAHRKPIATAKRYAIPRGGGKSGREPEGESSAEGIQERQQESIAGRKTWGRAGTPGFAGVFRCVQDDISKQIQLSLDTLKKYMYLKQEYGDGKAGV